MDSHNRYVDDGVSLPTHPYNLNHAARTIAVVSRRAEVLVAGLPDFNCQARTLLVVVVVTGRGREAYITREPFLDLRCYAAEAAGVGSLHSARGCTGSVGGRADGRRRRHCPI